ncbi:hypothetical protein ACVWWK_006275 [Bradyrhizobium sp. LB9.1b]
MIPIKVDLGVAPEINYSLLHNNRTLLDKLTLTRLIQHPVDAITIQVELCVGAENYPYRLTIPVMTELQLPLSSKVIVPLTASLTRSLHERVQSGGVRESDLRRRDGVRGNQTCHADPR